jgi:hypothetical protein
MATVTETTGALGWIAAQIAADATITSLSGYGGLWENIAPPSAPAPYIIAQLMSSTDVKTENGHRILSSQLWTLKGVAPAASYAALQTIAIELDALFGDIRQAGNANVVVSASVREQEVNYSEMYGLIQWRHVGGIFRLEVWLH